MFDVNQLLDAPADSRRGALGAALRRLARHDPNGLIAVPARVTTYRTIVYDADLCLGCGACARACPTKAIEARPPQATAEQTRAQAVPTADQTVAVSEVQS
jgi:ferredoxin